MPKCCTSNLFAVYKIKQGITNFYEFKATNKLVTWFKETMLYYLKLIKFKRKHKIFF